MEKWEEMWSVELLKKSLANSILISHNKNWGLDEKLVIDLVNKYLKKNNFENTQVGVWFVGRKKAKDLNIKYRSKSYIPQVLGFPLNKIPDVDGIIRLGDIVICTEKLKYEVRFMNSTSERILEEWVEHGVENLMK